MGAQSAGETGRNEGVSFLLDLDKIHVRILKPEDLMQRNAVLDAILGLSTLKSTYQLVYLAAPRLFGTSVDASIFRSRGIGLLLYDERRIDEAVPARPTKIEQTIRYSQHDDEAMITDLAMLKTRYLEMERMINQLRNDLTSLRESHPLQEQAPRIPVPTQLITAQTTFRQNVTHDGELPSYFINNPWLEVLSKRGTGEGEPIAG
jgi:hypothetical protein